MARSVELGTDAADAAIHHVGGRDHVGAGLGVTQRLLRQRLQGLVVHHVAARIGRVDEAILAVAGVGIERHVGDHAQLRETRLERLHRTRHQPLGVPGLFGALGLARRVDHREQGERGHAELQRIFGNAQQFVDRHALDAGHRGHGLGARFAIEHEDRVDQIVGGQDVLAHQTAREIVTAHAPHADRRKGSSGSHRDFSWFVIGVRGQIQNRIARSTRA